MTALAYTLGAFGLILVLARLRVPLAGAIFAGAVTAAVLFGLGAGDTVRTLALGLVQPRTLGLIAITIALLGLSGMMQEGGQMAKIVALAKQLFRRPAVTMAALPALIGLLPMPGGALFSAPMVASAAGEANVSGGRLSAVNYWFRHVWEHWWPLYPGVILAVTLTGGGFVEFIAYQLPLGLFMIAGGLLIFRGAHADLAAVGAGGRVGGALVRETASIWLIILIVVITAAGLWALPDGTLPPQIEGLSTFLPISMGLAVSLVWTWRYSRLDRRQMRRVWINGKILSMACLVATVMIFQYTLDEVRAAERIGHELEQFDVPVVVVVMALPFIAGMVTGLAVGFVGTSFPIVVALVATALPGEALRPYVVLAYAFGHLGQMLSPLHLCHVVSNRYFQTSFAPVYRRITVPAAVTGGLALGYFLLLKWLMG